MIREFIINWFVKNGSFSEEELINNMDINYLDKGIVDSFGFLGLISECEEKFEIEFKDEDFSNNNLFSINGIIKIIEKKREIK